MRLTEEERAVRREAFRRMSAAERAEYLLAYYKLPMILVLIALYILCYGTYRNLARKEVLLYVGFCNAVPGAETESALTEGFVTFTGKNPKKWEVYAYKSLYLSDNAALSNHEYAYASRLKIMAAIQSKQLDIVLMNREAYDILSSNGYLLELSDLRFPARFSDGIQEYLTENKVILQDNGMDVALGVAEEYEEKFVYQTNGIDISALPVIQSANLTDSVFLGVVPNSPRLARTMDYLVWLVSGITPQEVL